ncbi:MAG TPA: glycosyltransferase family 4 protein [Candidatus Eisenbacteria bacterium]|nr:glycosyltransferase family 4 protein [Candidatus Eisenbacteria bacterium]
MARFHDVTVLTRANNRQGIGQALEPLRGQQPLPEFLYHDLNPFLQRAKRYSRSIKLYYLLWQKSARELIQRLHPEQRFDLLHHVTFAAFRYPSAIWGHGVPCVWGPVGGIESVPTGLLPWRHPVSLVHEILRNINNSLQTTSSRLLPKRARATTLILASTPEMQQVFHKLGFSAELMPSIGLKTKEMSHRSRSANQGPLKLLFVGNIITLKGIDLAIDALKASGTDATFTLFGSGNYVSEIKRRAKKAGLAERTIFGGRIPRQQMLERYPDYDVLIFPSLHDTGGYAVIEAMFNQLPVICLDCGGPAATVQPGCGVKVALGARPKRVAELAEAIRRYDRDRQTMLAEGKAAREMVLNLFDWDKKGEQMNELYLATVARHRAAEKELPSRSRYSGIRNVPNFLHRRFSPRKLAVHVSDVLLAAVGPCIFISGFLCSG